MSGKHYSAGYLENTGDFLRKLKIHSYTPFSAIKEGTVVDLGCGTGIDAINLAGSLGSGVSVVGVDHDPALLAKAAEAAGELPNVRFEQGEATQLSFADGSVAGLRAERLVQHLPEPELAFQEMHRVLAKGQPIAIVETAWNSLNFYTRHTDIEQKIGAFLTTGKVKNGWAAQRLTHNLATSGFSDIRLDTFCMVGRSLDDANRYLWIGPILDEMKANGLLSAEEFDVFSDTMAAADADGHFLCSMNLVMATAVK